MSAEVFRKAADVLLESGHCKGSFQDGRGRVCVAGAIDAACRSKQARAGYLFYGAVEDIIPGDRPILSAWNDEPERTQAEVVAALDAAYIVALQESGIEPEDVL